MLSEIESQKDIDAYHEISDVVRQKILLAYRYRNPLTHSPEDWPEAVKNDFISYALIALISPVIKHYDKIFERLRGLISSDLSAVSPNVISILRLFEGERRKHLEIFGGRNLQLEEIQKRLEGDLRSRGAYLLLTGLEGIGKSAFCAKLVDNLTQHIIPIGRYAEEVKKHVPWLPGVIYHSGKQSKTPNEIVKSVVAQANTMLLNPLEISIKTGWDVDSILYEHDLDYNLNKDIQQIEDLVSTYSMSPQLGKLISAQSQKNTQLPLSEEIRRIIYSSLALVSAKA